MAQFTCPKCGMVGGNNPDVFPKCHVCNYEVIMLPSNNGRILMEAETIRSAVKVLNLNFHRGRLDWLWSEADRMVKTPSSDVSMIHPVDAQMLATYYLVNYTLTRVAKEK